MSVDTHAPATAAEQFAMRRQSPVQRIQHLLHSHPALSPLAVLVIAFIVFTIINPRFAQPATISIIIQQTAIIAALAIGQTLIILTAGIDLSVGAICILSMLFMANLAANNGVPGLLALILGIALGTFCGLVNGLLVTRLNLPPFIVTLGTFSIFTAIALLYSGGASVGRRDMPALLNVMGTPIPLGPFRLTVGRAVRDPAGRGGGVRAQPDGVGAAPLCGRRRHRGGTARRHPGRPGAAQRLHGGRSDLRPDRLGLIGRAGTASPNAIVNANLETITAVVIGGTSLFGGRGGILGTMLGALIVYAFNIGLSLAGVDDQLRVLAIGVLIIVAVAVDQWIRKVKA